MRYRELDANGDYVFGFGTQEFLVNTPDAVAQAVLTRLLLITGEWFLDITEGTPYGTKILGYNTKATYDAAIRERILDTENVTDIVSYASQFNSTTRALSVQATIDTAYGQTELDTVIP